MIHITRNNAPVELDTQKAQELVQKYLKNSDSVWSQSYIKANLLKMSSNKCAYCECKIDEESKFLEVEHFLPKLNYPLKVVDWDNLLPSCKRCNGQKSTHDPSLEPIINPCEDYPSNHIKMYNYFLKPIDRKGKTTIDVLSLNQVDRVVLKRMEVGTATIEAVEELLEKAEQYSAGINMSTRNKNKIKTGTRQVLREAQSYSEYSATVASILFTSDDFCKLIELMIEHQLWEVEHQSLLVLARKNILSFSILEAFVS